MPEIYRRPWVTIRGSATGDYGVWVECPPDRAQDVETALRRAVRWRCGVRVSRVAVARASAVRRTAACVGSRARSGVSAGCSWFTAFVEQPKLDPWEAVSFPTTPAPSRGNPQYSVPITAHSCRACRSRSAVAGHDRFDVGDPEPDAAIGGVAGQRPEAVSDQLAPCHGDAGKGDGAVDQVRVCRHRTCRDHEEGSHRWYISA